MIDLVQKPSYKGEVEKNSPYFTEGSRLVCGTSGLGGVWGDVDEKESISVILHALEHGIISMDSSPSYNHAEEFLGKALKQWKGEKPYISTKVGRLFAEKADEYHLDYTKEGMLRSVENSLKVIGVDALDILFLHEPHLVPMDQIDEIKGTLELIKEKGYAKKIGVGGNPTPEFLPHIDGQLFEVVSGFLKMDACNLTAFKRDIPTLQNNKVAYYAASALHMGLLGSRFDRHCGDRPNNEWITNQDVDNAIAVKAVADQAGIDLAELALRYVLSIKEADRVVIGARTFDQIDTTEQYLKKGALSEDVFNAITAAIK